MTIDLPYVGAKVLAHGREVRLEFRRDSEWPTNTIRPLPVLRPSRSVAPITLQRSSTTLRTFWSMSAWKRNFIQRSDGQWYGQTSPYSLFVYLHVHPDDLILRGQALSLSGSLGALDDILRNSGLRTAAFSSSTSDGGTLPPFVNASRVKAGGWFDDASIAA
jgi:hypothetical protein